MCYKVDASFVIMHLLKTKKDCTIKELVIKKYMIEEEIPSVFIDVSKQAVLNSVECYPEILEFCDDKISKKEGSLQFFEESVINYFDFDMDDIMRRDITKIIEHVEV